MFDNKEFFKNSKNFFLTLLIVSSLFLFFNILNIKQNTSDFLYFIVRPVNSVALVSSSSVKDFVSVFGQVKTLRGEYYDLKEEYLSLKADKNLISVLEEENYLLKKQLGVLEEGEEFILAEVLFQDWSLRNESLLINKGREHGVEEGDVVVLENMFIGIVNQVEDFNSKVRLPTSKGNSLKVMIVDSEVGDEIQSSLSGIAVGHSNVLKVENIEMQGELEKGFVVLVNDEKVGKQLFLGNVASIEDDPTATFRSCSVNLPVEYTDLKRVFVSKGGLK